LTAFDFSQEQNAKLKRRTGLKFVTKRADKKKKNFFTTTGQTINQATFALPDTT
jgi:hypothetical protein